MTAIEQKVILVREYIIAKKGIDIKDIHLVDGKDLEKLDYAYKVAYKFFYR